jgi:NAD(P)H-nitrite reductase large subunit
VNTYDYLIIGGGIAGVSAAEVIRERDPHGTIAILCDEAYPLYSRVLLPSFLKRRITREQLFLRTIDHFTALRIDLRLEERVVAVDAPRREVILSGETAFGYKKLLIASGGRVKPWSPVEERADKPTGEIVLDFPGGAQEAAAHEEHTYRLQTLADADRLYAALATHPRPLVIGGSFISLEFLEIFVTNQIAPTLLVREPHFFNGLLEAQGAELLKDNFERHGITAHFNDSIAHSTVRPGGSGIEVLTRQSRRIECDIYSVGVGIDRNMDFLQGSGVELGERGVRVNEYLQTNQEGVFAAGDVAEFYDLVAEKEHLIGNWTNAFLQGQHAGVAMTGGRAPFRHVSGYSITNLGFQITALGDCDAASAETLVRIDPDHRQYERFFIRKGALVGAILINRFADKTHLAQLIETKTPLEPWREQVKTFEFDIRKIPVVL